MTESNQKSFWNNDKKIEGLIIAIISATVIFAFIFSFIAELSNNITLVVEVGVGVIIAIIVFRTTKRSERQNQKTLDRIQEVENEQSELIKEMKPIIEKQGNIIEEQSNIIEKINHSVQEQDNFKIDSRQKSMDDILMLLNLIEEHIESMINFERLYKHQLKTDEPLRVDYDSQTKFNQSYFNRLRLAIATGGQVLEFSIRVQLEELFEKRDELIIDNFGIELGTYFTRLEELLPKINEILHPNKSKL